MAILLTVSHSSARGGEGKGQIAINPFLSRDGEVLQPSGLLDALPRRAWERIQQRSALRKAYLILASL